MTSSFSLCSSLILCVICAFLAIQSTSNPLADVCAKTKDLAYCLTVLKDCSHQNLYNLTESVIHVAGAKAFATIAKIDILLNQKNDRDLELIYILCSNYYNEALTNLGNAELYLVSGQYEKLNNVANIIEQDGFNCQKAFELFSGFSSIIIKENDDFQKISNIVVAAANLCLLS